MIVSILFVDTYNTSRAPMAKFVLKNLIKEKNLTSYFFVDSAGMDAENGIDMDEKTKAILTQNQIPYYEHESKQVKKEDYDKYEYIVAMDKEDCDELIKLFGDDPNSKVIRLLDFGYDNHDIENPDKTKNYEDCYQDIVTGCNGFMDSLLEN